MGRPGSRRRTGPRRGNPYLLWGAVAVSLVLAASVLFWSSGAGMDGPVSFVLATNLAAFVLYAYDKLAAVREGPRIPEIILIAPVLLMGWVGTEAGRRLFHHKTADVEFRRAYWSAAAVEGVLILVYVLVTRLG